MLHNKRNPKSGKERRGSQLLTKRDLAKIRSFLPLNWRQLIHEKHASIKLRQITEVFNQRTNNIEHNQAVWGTINEALRKAGQQELVKKVEKRLNLCAAMNNVIQAK